MDALKNIGLVTILVGSFIWAAVAPGMQALIPTFIAIASSIKLLERNTDWIKHF